MSTPAPVPPNAATESKPKIGKGSLWILSGLLAVFLIVAGPQCYDSFETGIRLDRQKSELNAMLANKGPRFRHVTVFPGKRDVSLHGYVRTDEEAAQLKDEMVRRLGAQVGVTAFFEVQVVPPGVLNGSTGKDFWAELEAR